MSLPTKEQIEDYLSSAEEFLSSSLTAVTPDLPSISDAIHRLWLDVSRFGPPQLPSLPDLHIPGLGPFEVPAPLPPPPPPPTSWLQDAGSWVRHNPRIVSGICAGALGVGLLAGYGAAAVGRAPRRRSGTVRAGAVPSRRQVVVVLGGDTPLGLPLITALELDGFIVIASVSTPEAARELEKHGNGFVRALVFDPKEPEMMSYFLRSLQAVLSLRFPINVAGDPYHSSTLNATYVHSVISLLTLPSPATAPMPMPFEHLPLTSTYSTYLMQTHIAPLQAIQAMLPLFRTSHHRARDAQTHAGGQRAIVLCVPAADARVGVPFAAAQAMGAAATVRGAEVLRREIRAAAAGGAAFEAMSDLKVVVVDVGSVASDAGATTSGQYTPEDLEKSMAEWTPSERSVYGGVFSYALEQIRGQAPQRRPASVDVFVNALIGTVGGHQSHGRREATWALWFTSKFRNWRRGDRFAIGAGAGTYTAASYMPRVLLDAVLNLPSLVASARNAVVVMPSRHESLAPVRPRADRYRSLEIEPTAEIPLRSSDASFGAETESPNTARPTVRVATDVESDCEHSSSVEGSWVSLQDEA